MTIKWEISRTLYNRNGRTSIKDFDTVGYIERERERVEWEIANFRKYLSKTCNNNCKTVP